MKRIVFLFFLLAYSVLHAADLTVVERNGMALTGASVDGVDCTLLVDTGASHTTLDLGFVTNRLPQAELREVQLLGRTNVTGGPKFVKTASLAVGEATFATEGLMVLDLGHLSAAVGRRVDGILGMNHLRERPCVLSLQRRRLIWDPSAEEREGFHPVMTRERGPTLDLLVKLPSGRIVPLLVDTGSTFTFLNRDLWPESEDTVAINATDVNRRSDRGFTRGQRGELNCGMGFKLTVAPMLTEEQDRNQLGYDVFKATDLLIDGRVLKLR